MFDKNKRSFYIKNVYSEQTFDKGEICMNWVKRNQNTALFMVFAVIFMAILLLINRDTTTYTNIKVQEGDTLWSLSDRYKGDLSNAEWVRLVKNENNIMDDEIIAGHTLIIPDHKQTDPTNKEIVLASDKNDE